MANWKQITGMGLVLVIGFLWGFISADMYCIVMNGFSIFGG